MRQKIVLITGGSSGIGRSIGLYLQSKGYKVYGTTRNLQNYLEFSDFKLIELDVRDNASITLAIDNLIDSEGYLDVLINNAGIGITGPIEETPEAEIKKAFHGPINVARVALPQMRKQNSGLIINITSIAGYMGLPYRGIYSASKGALEILTEALRMETKDFGIKITNLAPGDFATNIAAGRYHTPANSTSPYYKSYSKTLNIIDDHVQEGQDPIRVAEMVFKIINTTNPKIHYKVGSPMQKFSLVLKKILPDKVYERLLLNHYKL
jgi:short-subunit dehydrogenase